MSGVFITLEGGEGVGKSTQLAVIREHLVSRGLDVVVTREPGGTPFAESIRELLLAPREEPVSPQAELLLMFAARAAHLEQRIRPALADGKWVVCDRFTDATYAYQGGGRGMSRDDIAELETLVQRGFRPHATLLLDAPVEVGLGRMRQRSAPDRFEREQQAFFERVREAYLERAAAEPDRFIVIDASRAVEEVSRAISDSLDDLLERFG